MANSVPQITVDQLLAQASEPTLGDYEVFERMQRGKAGIGELISVLSRLTHTDTEQIRVLSLAQTRELVTRLIARATGDDDDQGEADGGDSTGTSGAVKGRRRSGT